MLELKLGREGHLHTLWVRLFACFIKIMCAFPVRQPLTSESCSGTEILCILGLVLRALFQPVKGHEHKISWFMCSLEPNTYYIKSTITSIQEHKEHRHCFPHFSEEETESRYPSKLTNQASKIRLNFGTPLLT